MGNSNLVQGLVGKALFTHAHACVCEHIARGHDDGEILLTLPPDLGVKIRKFRCLRSIQAFWKCLVC